MELDSVTHGIYSLSDILNLLIHSLSIYEEPIGYQARCEVYMPVQFIRHYQSSFQDPRAFQGFLEIFET